METINSIEKKDFNAKPFKIVYIILFAVILIVDMIIIILLFRIWANLEVVEYIKNSTQLIGFFLYNLILFSPIVKVVFEIYEVTRFIRFSKSSNQNKESAINVAKGFKGTRIYRIYYLVLIAYFTLMTEILEFEYMTSDVVEPNPTAFLRFSLRFAILLFIHLLTLIMGPRIIKFSIDYMNKKMRNMIIFDIILWTIILIVVLNFSFIVQFIILLKARIG